MTIFDKTTHGVNALVCIAGCLTAADATATGGAGMGAFMSIKEIFRRGTPTQQAIYARTKAALDAALDNAHLTPDDRDKIHYAIKAGCPTEDTIIALGRDPQAVAEDMSKALSKTDATDTLRDTFVSIVASVLNDTLKDPDSARELASAYQKAMLDFRQEANQHFQSQTVTAREMNAKLDALLAQNKGLMGILDKLADGDGFDASAILTFEELQLLAKRFQAPNTDSKDAILEHLRYQAEQIAQMEADLHALRGIDPALDNILGAIEAALDKGDLTEARALFPDVRSLQKREHLLQMLSEDARISELEARTALLDQDADTAYLILSDTADTFKRTDPIAAAQRRHLYCGKLYNHGLRYGGPGLPLAADMIRPAITALKDTKHRIDWAGYTQNLAITLQDQSNRTVGKEATALLAEAITAYRDALTVFTKTNDPEQWAKTLQNLATALHDQGTRTAGAEGTALLAEAVAAYRDALTVFTKADYPEDWSMTKQNLANALQEQGNRTAGEDGTALLAEAVTAYQDVLTVRTKADHPVDWATTQQNLAGALQLQGARTAGVEGAAFLAEAVTAYRDALTVRTEADHPMDWAFTQQNLAVALDSQGERTDGQGGLDSLGQALSASEAALTVFTKADDPASWAMTQENLALCQRRFAQHPATSDPAPHWDAALAHVDAALTVYDDNMTFYLDKATTLRDDILARR